MPDPVVQAHFVDTFIIGLLNRAGLQVKTTRTPTHTTLKITLKRAPQTS